MPTLSNTITIFLAKDLDLNGLLLLLSSSPSSSSVYLEFGNSNRGCESSNFQFCLAPFFSCGGIVFGFDSGLGFEDL
jgi:hypothetical protein